MKGRTEIENRMLRRIFGLKSEEVMGGWRKLLNEELLYSSLNIRMGKSQRMGSAGHALRIWREEMCTEFW
jgi:hypothetical protein